MRSSKAKEPFGEKLLLLEILRFFSSVAILIWHYQHFFLTVGSAEKFSRENQPFYSLLKFFYEYGVYGVQVFWCISGFIFFWKYSELLGNKAIGAYEFFVLRLSRLYPLHVATLLVVAILQEIYLRQNGSYFVYQYNDVPHFIYQLFLASHWGMQQGFSFNGPIWSISVEVVIYFYFYLTFRIIRAPLGVIALSFLILTGAMMSAFSSPIIDCLAFFYLGGSVSVLLKRYGHLTHRFKLRWVARLCGVSIVILGLLDFPRAGLVFELTCLIALAFAIDYLATARPWLQLKIRNAGNMTYAIYLCHFPVQLTISLLLGAEDTGFMATSPWFFAIFVFVIFGIARAVYRYFELPTQDFIRQRWISREK